MNGFEKMLDFLATLKENGLSFTLHYIREDTVMVLVVEPGRYWEVEFFADGHVEVEVYESRAGVEGEEALAELFGAETIHVDQKRIHGDVTLSFAALAPYENGFTAYFQMRSASGVPGSALRLFLAEDGLGNVYV